jgi:hypothetical protein
VTQVPLAPARQDGRVNAAQPSLFGSVDEAAERLAGVGYLASTAVADQSPAALCVSADA